MLNRQIFGAVLVAALGLAGCKPSGDGCSKDSDCKGDRVCASGACADPAGGARVAADRPPAGQGATPVRATVHAPVAAVDPSVLAADGLPVEIPAPGSPTPNLADWNAITREVTARGSSAVNCQTKMIREWLKVRCARKGDLIPATVTVSPPAGVLAFTFNGHEFTDLVVQVVRGRGDAWLVHVVQHRDA